MVDSITSYSRSGLRDWFIQRASSLIITACFFTYLFFWLTHPHPIFPEWHHFFTCPWVRVLTLFTILSIIVHAWIGMWVVFTDYIKAIYLRLFLQVGMILLLLGCGVYATKIVWGA